MKKIIMEGTQGILDKVRRFGCENCKCIFDSDEYKRHQYDDHSPIYFYSKCPVCGVMAYEYRFWR